MSTTPEVSVTPAQRHQEPVLSSLSQLYVHDLSDIGEWEVDESGHYGFGGLVDCWPEPGKEPTVLRHPFLIRAAGQVAGFAVVSDASIITGDRDVTDMAEFFVVRRWRRHGVGRAAVRQLVAAFPGRWEIRPFPGYAPAAAFWATVCAELAADGVRTGPIPGYTMPNAQVLAFTTKR
jgi:predicted acetyltransferase